MGRLTTKGPLAVLARIGYVARGLVFLLIGGIALMAAFGAISRPHGASDSFRILLEHPFGGIIAWVIAAGLVCFAGWRFLQALFDADRHGNDLRGLLRRSALGISGLFYVALAAVAANVTIQAGTRNEKQSAQDWTAWLMAQPLGSAMVAGIGLIFVGVAIALVVKVVRAPYQHRISGRKVTRAWAVALGSAGIATRAFVFFMIGAFLVFAAYRTDARDEVGWSGALRTLHQQAYGGFLLAIAALGLIAFGCFELLEAAARRISTPQLTDLF